MKIGTIFLMLNYLRMELVLFYILTRVHFLKVTVLIRYHFQALETIFPEYSWDISKFRIANRNSREMQRKLFDDIAKRLGIKEPSGWYHITKNEVIKHKGAGGTYEVIEF